MDGCRDGFRSFVSRPLSEPVRATPVKDRFAQQNTRLYEIHDALEPQIIHRNQIACECACRAENSGPDQDGTDRLISPRTRQARAVVLDQMSLTFVVGHGFENAERRRSWRGSEQT